MVTSDFCLHCLIFSTPQLLYNPFILLYDFLLLEDRCKQEFFKDLINQILLKYDLLANLSVHFVDYLFCQLDQSNHETFSVGSCFLLGDFICSFVILIIVFDLLFHFVSLYFVDYLG